MKNLTQKEEEILLAILHLKNQAYLVSIREKLNELTGKYLDVGSINKPLKKLEREGHLSSLMGKPSPVRGGKAIKYYLLTDKGYEALAQIRRMRARLWRYIVLPERYE